MSARSSYHKHDLLVDSVMWKYFLRSKLIEYAILFAFLKYVVLTRDYTISIGALA